MDQVRDIMRLKYYAYRTERTYTGWIKHFALFQDKKHPGEIYRVASKNFTGSLLEETEKEIIKCTLEETRYNISRASFILGISRATLYKGLKKYRISLPGKDV